MKAFRLFLAAVLTAAVAVWAFWMVTDRGEPPADPRVGINCMDEPDGAGVYCWRF